MRYVSHEAVSGRVKQGLPEIGLSKGLRLSAAGGEGCHVPRTLRLPG